MRDIFIQLRHLSNTKNHRRTKIFKWFDYKQTLASSSHGMIPSFHAVFGLRHRGKSAKVIDYNDQVIWVREYLLLLGIPHVFYWGFFWLSKNFWGQWLICESYLPVLLSRIGLAISVPLLPVSDAVHCNRSRSALHPSLQCTASSTLILAIFPASTCIRPCKYVRPPLQVLAGKDAII